MEQNKLYYTKTEKKQFEKSLTWTRTSLLLAGVNISKIKFRKPIAHFFKYYMYFFNIFILYFDIYGEVNSVIDGILKGISFVNLSITVPNMVITILSNIKVLCLYFNYNVIYKIINKLNDLHPEFPDDDIQGNDIGEVNIKVENGNSSYGDVRKEVNVKKEIVQEADKLIKIMRVLLFSLCGLLVVCFLVMPISSMAYDLFTVGTTEWKFPFLVKYFFDAYTALMWSLIYLHHAASTVLVYLNIVGTDSLLYIVCIYIRMHFRLLCLRIQNVVDSPPQQIRENVVKVVRRHQELIALTDDIEVLFSKASLFNVFFSSVLICLSGFIMTVLDEIYVVVIYTSFLIMSLNQIGLLCYFGDMLMRSSTEVSSAVYNSLWYEADQATKKTLLLILMRAQKPCKLTAWSFIVLNLTAYSTILSRSWSYFALLRTMYK